LQDEYGHLQRRFVVIGKYAPAAQTEQNLNRVVLVWLFHDHGLEPALQGWVFFDVQAVFLHRGRPDALQLASCEGNL
jgi:hypothetical protein|tara:strand:- start:5188 stop:5418 length:231 start_codon:yes stop_codon:yes gene_type:complete